MSKIDRSVLSGPKVLGRDRLDERRSAYALEAPFDMSDPTGLIGMKALLDDKECEVRGFVAMKPPRAIRAGEPIELLVVAPSG